MKRFRKLICKWFGHSYSPVDVLVFQITCEGRAYTQDLLTGEQKPLTHAEIVCRCCGEIMRKKL